MEFQHIQCGVMKDWKTQVKEKEILIHIYLHARKENF